MVRRVTTKLIIFSSKRKIYLKIFHSLDENWKIATLVFVTTKLYVVIKETYKQIKGTKSFEVEIYGYLAKDKKKVLLIINNKILCLIEHKRSHLTC